MNDLNAKHESEHAGSGASWGTGAGHRIAIVGAAGRFPQSESLGAFWANLAEGRDLVTEVPAERWDWRAHWSASSREKNKTISKWGGFLEGWDRFDAGFFQTSPREARLMDPQQRVLLEVGWHALEDAGLRPSAWTGRKVGVFVGACQKDYAELLDQRLQDIDAYVPTGTCPSILANRISFALGFQGPSLTVNTACSSSLVALHLAMRALREGECELALVGGVNICWGPKLFVASSRAGMLSDTGKCNTFSSAANGYVRGEGCGVVVLRALPDALREGDRIHAVLRGSAVNHGGKVSGLTVPNAAAQAAVIVDAFKDAGVGPGQLSYVEAHGTGTKLGDPVEIHGLKMAFARMSQGAPPRSDLRGYCGVGSVKTNIGHLEGAAGMAGLLKVVMAMRHRTLPATLNLAEVNPLIRVEESPFSFVTKPREWTPLRDDEGREIARTAGISSFGFGGANAHVVLEEAPAETALVDVGGEGPWLFVLSAKDQDRLRDRARALLGFVEDELADMRLLDVAYTLQVGREEMAVRLAIVASDARSLAESLLAFVEGRMHAGLFPRATESARLQGESGAELDALAARWVAGDAVEWAPLYQEARPRRVGLPGYPFARERYWFEERLSAAQAPHPLVDAVSDDGSARRGTKRLRRDEFVLRDHLVGTAPTLPGVGILEMVRAAAGLCHDAPVRRLASVVFRAPIQVEDEKDVFTTFEPDGNLIRFRVSSAGEGGGEAIVHAQGKLALVARSEQAEREVIDLAAIQARCPRRVEPEEGYALAARLGLHLGPSFRSVEWVQSNDDEAIAKLRLPDHLVEGLGSFVLHPSLMDGAQQALTLSGLLGDEETIRIPFTVGEIDVRGPLPRECFSYCRLVPAGAGASASLRKVEIRVVDPAGAVILHYRDFTARAAKLGDTKPTAGASRACIRLRGEWRKSPSEASALGGGIVLLEAAPGANDELVRALTARGAVDIVRVRPALSFALTADGGYTVDPERRDDWARLFAHVQHGGRRVEYVLHLWHNRAPADRALALGPQTLSLASAELVGARAAQRVTVLSLGVQCDGALNPLEAATAGFSRSLTLESSRVACRAVEVSDASPDVLADIIAREIGAAGRVEPEVRYTDRERWARELVVLDEAYGDDSMTAGAVREGGTYLITGGLGGLGLIAAETLAASTRVNLVLVGRSPIGERGRSALEALASLGSCAVYEECDVADGASVAALVDRVKARFGAVHGVVHTAGVLGDALVANAKPEQIREVCAPKVQGILHLDEQLAGEPLELFVAFSSIAGQIGNVGQSAYAFANRYLDAFMVRREALRARGERRGRSVSIAWPLWESGGMSVDAGTAGRLERSRGIVPMPTDVGAAAFRRALRGDAAEIVCMYGDPRVIGEKLRAGESKPTQKSVDLARVDVATAVAPQSPKSARTVAANGKLDIELRREAARVVGQSPEKIGLDTNLSDYGFDSIGLTDLSNALNEKLGIDTTPAVFFEYPTLGALRDFLLEEHADAVSARYPSSPAAEEPPREPAAALAASTVHQGTPRPEDRSPSFKEPIAIIGMSGTMPQSPTLNEFWAHLEAGHDLVTEIPSDRWDWRDFYGDPSEDNKTNIKWGAFIDDVDKFDARFFGISRREAEFMDPQQRLYLQTVWACIEDAGYRVTELARQRVGVFAAVASLDYQELLIESGIPVEPYSTTGVFHSILANRISYLLNFSGPSVPVDTACSSAIVAVRQAIESIWTGGCDLAVAGGIQLLLSPRPYLSFSKAGMLSPDGRSKTFDKDANGYVRGEGSGALLLKPLRRALADGDHIHAIIRGSVVNHGGRVNTMTAPNPNAQADMIKRAFAEANVDPATVTYMEAHGTGTSLGDPIEVNGLKKAFRDMFRARGVASPPEGYCAVGSVKTNLGHLETSAAMAGILKVILAMKAKKIPPSLHLKTLNPYIKLEESPFFHVGHLCAWEPARDENGKAHPRRAGVSSMGFGGVNGHILLEEHLPTPRAAVAREERLVVLSAKTPERLRDYAASIAAHAEKLAMGDNSARSDGTGPLSYPGDSSTHATLDKADLRLLVCTVTGARPEDLEDEDRLNEIGLDQGQLRLLADAVAQRLGLAVPLELLAEAQTLEALSLVVSRLQAARPPVLAGIGAAASFVEDDAESLADLAYTLQAGREPMRSRVAVVASSLGELAARLAAFSRGDADIEGLSSGAGREEASPFLALLDGPEGASFLAALAAARDLRKLGRLWASGVDLDWAAIGALAPGRRTPLPTYPFAKDRYWRPAKPGRSVPLAPAGGRASSLEVDLRRSIEARLTFVRVLAPDMPIVRDHVVQGRHLFPGVGQLALVLEAAERLEPLASFDVHDTVWLRPLFVPDGGARAFVRLARGAGGVDFEVFSDGEAGEVIHSRGTLAHADADDVIAIDVEAIRARCARNYERSALYERFRRWDLELGPYFQPFREAWLGDDEAIATIDVHAEHRAECGSSVLHPTLMDAALQASGLLQFDAPGATRVPFAVELVEVRRRLGEAGYAYAKRTGPLGFDVTLIDNEGHLCVRFRGVAMREVDGARAKQAADPWQGSQPYLRREWRLAPVSSGEPREVRGSVLVVTPSGADAATRALRAALVRADVHELVLDGEASGAVSSDDPRGISNALAGLPRLSEVFFLGGVQRSGGAWERGLEQSLVGLYRTVRALQEHGYEDMPLAFTVVTTDAHAVREGDEVDPRAAAVLGFARAMAKELGAWAVRAVDVRAEDVARAEVIDAMLREPAQPDGREVLFRGGRRYQDALVPIEEPRPSQPAFREKGTYVILGGAGGIGFELALHLARTAHANVVLIGRSAPDEGTREKVEGIARAGGQALYLQADASDVAQLTRAVTHTRSRFGAIHGVVHSALVLRDRTIANLDEETLRATLRPKIAGGVALVEAFAEERLDFLLFFSSVQSFAASRGQSAYAAASAFEDAFAAQCVAKGLPAHVINWGFWGTVGVVASERYRKLARAQGFRSIPPEAGMAAIEATLGSRTRAIIVAPAEPEALEALGVEALAPAVGATDGSGHGELKRALSAVEQFTTALALRALRDMGGLPDGEARDLAELRRTLRVSPAYVRWLEAVVALLARAGAIQVQADGRIIRASMARDSFDPPRERERLLAAFPGYEAYVRLAWACFEGCPAMVRGDTPATQILFPDSSMALVAGVYRDNPTMDFLNRRLSDEVVAHVATRLAERPEQTIRVLEIGAGTGGTSAQLLAQLAQFEGRIEYVYTDVSRAFLEHGKRQFATRYPFVTLRVFDVERSPRDQGIEIGIFDVVVATNVLHATRRARDAARHARALLRPGGRLLLNETTAVDMFLTFTFGFLGGWWRYDDDADRLPHSPLLSSEGWSRVLRAEGFDAVAVVDADVESDLGRSVIVARAAAKADLREEKLAGPRRDEVRGVVTAVVERLLDARLVDFPAGASFSEMGIDSILAVDMAKQLNEQLGIKLRSTDVFNYVTVEALAEHIATLPVVAATAAVDAPRSSSAAPARGSAPATVSELRASVKQVLEQLLDARVEDFPAGGSFSEMGIDSILAVDMAKRLNERLGVKLRSTDVFNFVTVETLAQHLASVVPQVDAAGAVEASRVARPVAPSSSVAASGGERSVAAEAPARRAKAESIFSRAAVAPRPREVELPQRVVNPRPAAQAEPARIALPVQNSPVSGQSEPIAIVGISGRFPDAPDVRTFWRNLEAGVDSVREVTRWSIAEHFNADPAAEGKSYGKWSGTLADADQFDPLFFNISPKEAEVMDPRQRLFLQEAWRAFEDAGLSDRALSGASCGVFVGCAGGDYKYRFGDAGVAANAYTFAGNQTSMVPARIAYFLNLRGPSVTVDTACSSSLVALHLACENIRSGHCDLALAGGVEAFFTHEFHVQASRSGMLSPTGRCRAFGQGADGFVPGEAVGALVLMSLSRALREGHHVYGVVAGSGTNQDGKSNGITAPNGPSQTALEESVYARFGIDPRDVSYVEAHGTGTKLGDPIEIEALTDAFRRHTADTQFCAIGSVKSNIGHALTASGIAGIIKVLLQMQHRKLVPTLHADAANGLIDFASSPFFISEGLAEWRPRDGAPRLALVSSFGLSGTNAHVVLREAPSAVRAGTFPQRQAYVFPLSAKTEVALVERIADLARWLDDSESVTLADIEYTLTCGRTHLPVRTAIVARDYRELERELRAALVGSGGAGRVFGASVPASAQAPRSRRLDAGREEASAVAEAFVQGEDPDWDTMLWGLGARRISLPTYPFARERHWVDESPSPGAGAALLHPFLQRNDSDFAAVRFSTTFTPRDSHVADHVIDGRPLLPGAVFLEAARAAGEIAGRRSVTVLRDVIWVTPLSIEADVAASLTLKPAGDAARVELWRGTGDERLLIAEAHAEFVDDPSPSAGVDLAGLRERLPKRVSHEECYRWLESLGLRYGQTFRRLREVRASGGEVLAEIEPRSATVEPMPLDPSLLDAGLQAVLWLVEDVAPGRRSLPLGVKKVRLHASLGAAKYVHVKAGLRKAGLRHFSVAFLDVVGTVLVELLDFVVKEHAGDRPPSSANGRPSRNGLGYAAEAFFADLLARETKVPLARVAPDVPFEAYGMDSMMVTSLNRALDQHFDEPSRTLFFEHRTLRELAGYFVEHHQSRLAQILAQAPGAVSVESQPAAPHLVDEEVRAPRVAPVDADIAIIGLAGRYPMADDVEELWLNLRSGRDCIEEIPLERWDHRPLFDARATDGRKSYSKWGGFVREVDKFDPLFFNISPREAELMDPQERLFLEASWHAFEDAGMTRAALRGRRVGVFVGAMYAHYQLVGATSAEGDGTPATGDFFAAIANRVSYFFDLRGPSIALDTMCSSSLTALHLACTSLAGGESELALVGGVNLTLHPYKYRVLSQGRFASHDGRCRSFGEGGDGYVPGEGVGAVVLKPLARAMSDGDRIYGVIRATALNHGGRTNAVSVPNPNAQAEVIAEALVKAGISPARVSYVEAHGTGTELGDPIEVTGLCKAFRGAVREAVPCALGSIKSNIGHLESAAGIAGLTKVLLQMQHGELAPSLHSQATNPNIRFEGTPFVVQQTLAPWNETVLLEGGAPRVHPRVAGVSSFGAGGANAHVVVEEHLPARAARVDGGESHVVVLSARDHERLIAYAATMAAFVTRNASQVGLVRGLAFTTHGRESMEARLAIVARSAAELAERLGAVANGRGSEAFGTYVGTTSPGSTNAVLRSTDAHELARSWVGGAPVDWTPLFGGDLPERIWAPGYPFARDRFWITDGPMQPGLRPRRHPFLGRERAEGDARVLAVDLGGFAWLSDHRVAGAAVVPAAVIVEMARAAGPAGASVRDVVFLRPLPLDGSLLVELVLRSDPGGNGFELWSQAEGSERRLHARGALSTASVARRGNVDVSAIERRCRSKWTAERCYDELARVGLDYGPAFRSIRALAVGDGEALARLQLPALLDEAGGFFAHPSLFDGALQSIAGLLAGEPLPRVPYALGEVVQYEQLGREVTAYVKRAAVASPDVDAFDVLFLGESGDVIGYITRVAVQPKVVSEASAPQSATVLLRPRWAARGMAAKQAARDQGCILVLGHGGALETAFVGHLVAGAQRVEVLRGAPHTGQQEASSIQRVQEAAIDECLARLQARGDSPVTIVSFWPLRSPASVPLARELARCAEVDAHALFALARGVASRPPAKLVCVCSADTADAAPSPLSAMLRTIHREEPRTVTRCIGVCDADVEREAIALVDEIDAADSGCLDVRYRGGEREVLTWDEHSASAAPVPLRDRGVYLVTGGAGGIGQLVARHLVDEARAQVALVGRSPQDARIAEIIAQLRGRGGDALYLQADVGDELQARNAVAEVRRRFGPIHGVFHAAGVTRDALVRNKSWSDAEQVLAPKVRGTSFLDEATAEDPLDLFVLFSSAAASFGSAGQSDYSFANGFLGSFSAWRNARARVGERRGRAVAIDWPLWESGAMTVSDARRAWMERALGWTPLPTASAWRILGASVEATDSRLMVLQGNRRRILETLPDSPPATTAETTLESTKTTATPQLGRGAEELVRKYVAAELKLAPARIGVGQRFADFGMDSVMMMNVTLALESIVGPLPKTLFFEYPTTHHLAEYLVATHDAALHGHLGGVTTEPSPTEPAWGAPVAQDAPTASGAWQDIAIVGLAGRYPSGDDLDAFWAALKAGKDCISELPEARRRDAGTQDWTRIGRAPQVWGGFLADVDKFDSLFFSISPLEASVMDPQERLFLETAWHAMEDAGYTRQDLERIRSGVFVGAMYAHYQLLGLDARARDVGLTPVSLHASIANRVSHVLGCRGPSVAVDTMCSSSLTAIQLACNALILGECDIAFAGGVNVTVHPNKYRALDQAGFSSTDGRCRSFGEGGDGYVPGEGVGALVLKPLRRALADGDLIHGVIKGIAVNHGGRAGGYTVPSPVAQAEVISEACRRAGVSPADISYVEAHGTGTALGDPVELRGLARAYGDAGARRCAVGSVKSNIGHLESAAGVAAVTKVLLQMRHHALAPSIHTEVLNSKLDFEGTPFAVQRTLTPWSTESGVRRAGISSFGAGGANAHLVLEEPPAANAAQECVGALPPQIVVLSARDREGLATVAKRLRRHLDAGLAAADGVAVLALVSAIAGEVLGVAPEHLDADEKLERLGFATHALDRLANELRSMVPERFSPTRLADNTLRELAASVSIEERADARGDEYLQDLAFTLQRGREPFEQRVAIVALGVSDLRAKLELFCDSGTAADVFTGAANDLESDSVRAAIAREDWRAIAQAWASGASVPWELVHQAAASRAGRQPRRVSLPTYPFARRRHWIVEAEGEHEAKPLSSSAPPGAPDAKVAISVQHALSPLDVRFRDHKVAGEVILPGVGYLELARQLVARIAGERSVELSRVVVAAPLRIREASVVTVALEGDRMGGRFEVRSEGTSRESVVHAEGRYACLAPVKVLHEDLDAARRRCTTPVSAAELYQRLAAAGIDYGEGYRRLVDLHTGEGEVVAHLAAAPDSAPGDGAIHLALADAAVQAVAALVPADAKLDLRLPFAFERVELGASMDSSMIVHVSRKGSGRFDIAVHRRDGVTCLRLHDVTFRPVPARVEDDFFYVPRWRAEPLASATRGLGAPPVFVVIAREESRSLGEAIARAGGAMLLGPERWADELGRALDRDAAGIPGVCFVAAGDGADRDDDADVHALFELVTVLRRRGLLGRPASLAIVTDGGCAVSKEEVPRPSLAALHAFAKTLAREQADWSIVRIDVRADESQLDDIASAVLRERPSAPSSDIAYRNGERFVRRLTSLRLDHPTRPVLREGGVYLVVGGAGGIGAELGRHLGERYRARLVILGRSELTAERRQALRSIESAGGRVLYLRADVCDEAAVTSALARARSELGPIQGVFHSAVVLRDESLQTMDHAAFAAALDPKTKGARNVHRALDCDPLEFAVFFSSAVAFTGNAGQANYAAGCAYQDAFAARLRREVSYPVKTIDWGFWGDVGVVAHEGYRRMFAANGVRSISVPEGMEAVERVLSDAVDQVFAMKIDERRREAFGIDGAVREPPSSHIVAVHSPAPPLPRHEASAGAGSRLAARIAGCVAAAIHVEPRDIDCTKQFSDYGVDSIVGVKLVNRINDELGIVLRTTILFDYPSVDELAGHLERQLGSPAGMRVVRDKPPVVPNATNGASEIALLEQLAKGELTVDQIFSQWNGHGHA